MGLVEKKRKKTVTKSSNKVLVGAKEVSPKKEITKPPSNNESSLLESLTMEELEFILLKLRKAPYIGDEFEIFYKVYRVIIESIDRKQTSWNPIYL